MWPFQVITTSRRRPQKMNKYVDLQTECQRIWNKKVEVIPLIIGATGIVDKNIKKYVGRIPGHHNIYSLQWSAILGTAHILRKVLSIKLDYIKGQDIQHHVSPRCRDYTWQNIVKKQKKTENQRQKIQLYVHLYSTQLSPIWLRHSTALFSVLYIW